MVGFTDEDSNYNVLMKGAKGVSLNNVTDMLWWIGARLTHN